MHHGTESPEAQGCARSAQSGNAIFFAKSVPCPASPPKNRPFSRGSPRRKGHVPPRRKALPPLRQHPEERKKRILCGTSSAPSAHNANEAVTACRSLPEKWSCRRQNISQTTTELTAQACARHDLVISSRSTAQKNGAPRLGTRLSSMSAGRGAPGKTGDRSVVAFFLSDEPCKGERPFCSSPRPARSRTARQGRVPEKARGSGPGLPETSMRVPRGVRPAASPSPAGNSDASLASCSPGACFRPFVFDGSLPLVHAHGGKGRAGACPARRRVRPAPPFPSRRAHDGLRTPAPRSTPPFRDCRRRRRPTPPSSA